MPTITATFDQPAYSPGDRIIMTITVTDLTDPAPRTITIRGEVFLDGQPTPFTGDLVLDPPPSRITGIRLTDGGGYTWIPYTPPADMPLPLNTFQFTATA